MARGALPGARGARHQHRAPDARRQGQRPALRHAHDRDGKLRAADRKALRHRLSPARPQWPWRRAQARGARLQPLQAAFAVGPDGTFLRRAVLVALGWAWAAAIVWLSLTPSPPKVDFEQSDKLGHFLAYGSLMLWFCLLYAATKARIGYALGFIAMGVGLEFI